MSYQQIKDDPEMLEFFQRLPAMVQESIAQSGVAFSNVQQMKSMVWDMERFQQDGICKQ